MPLSDSFAPRNFRTLKREIDNLYSKLIWEISSHLLLYKTVEFDFFMNLKKSFYWCFLYTLLCIFSNLNIFQFCRRRSHHNNGNGGQSDAESDASGISWASGSQVNLIKNQTIYKFLLFPPKSAIKVHVF